MSNAEILRGSKKDQKPAYLISTIEELVSERDYMEANWSDSMRDRMQTIASISITKFKTPLSLLSV